jgi:hypothetical protein
MSLCAGVWIVADANVSDATKLLGGKRPITTDKNGSESSADLAKDLAFSLTGFKS